MLDAVPGDGARPAAALPILQDSAGGRFGSSYP